jgi:hypothetical protein
LGELIYSVNAAGNTVDIDVSQLAKAVYTVEVQTDKAIARTKFVKE